MKWVRQGIKKLIPKGINIIIFGLILACSQAYAMLTKSQVCFAPFEDCLKQVVKHISNAKLAVYLQAYDLSEPGILRALIVAKQRGTLVKVIIDKSQWRKYHQSGSRILVNHGVPVWVEYQILQARNNTLIIDKDLVITGSLTFSPQAQAQHAATLLFIWDEIMAKTFRNNWHLRQKLAKPIYFQVEGLPESMLKNKKSYPNGVGASPSNIYKLYLQLRN